MPPIFIAVAFFLGLLARQVRLPPMVGFLVAGFILQSLGQDSPTGLQTISDLGVTLLLFIIGLKLQVRSPAPKFGPPRRFTHS
ncbi:MAG: cation:proton antiporter [Akkermansiaceae bacterium]